MHPQKMMGFESPGDKKVPVPVRNWNAMKRALWRSKVGWEIAAREAALILSTCAHLDGCPGRNSETEPCFGGVKFDPDAIRELGCPDRELRASALVILNASRQFAPIDARQLANEPYYAPTREYFSEVIAELAAAQAELEVLRAAAGAPTLPPKSEDK